MKLVKRNQLRVVCSEACDKCGGAGLRIANKYNDFMRTLNVTVDVCPCVKVVIYRGQNQHTKNEDLSS